jgi:Sec-independent protein secretion pathway component TatC
MLLEAVPLYLLFELSLVVATVAERRGRAAGQRHAIRSSAWG